MITCEKCGKRLVTPTQMERHLASVHGAEPVSEKPVVDQAPVPATPVTVTESPSEKVVLRFKVAVEVTINGVKYEGKVIEAPNMEIASEIVRIIRDSSYGDVLER